MASEKFKDKIIKVFGMEIDDNDEYYDDEVEEVVEELKSTHASQQKKTASGQKRTCLSGIGAVPEVLVLNPEHLEDAPGIVNKIKEDKTIVVNFKNAEYEDGQKIFNFLNGAVFALEGSISRIADNVFILAPKQVSVSTSVETDESDIITPILNWDDK